MGRQRLLAASAALTLALAMAGCSVHDTTGGAKPSAASKGSTGGTESATGGFRAPTTIAKGSGRDGVVPPDQAVDPNADTDRGITPDTITIGFVVFKPDTFAQFGVTATGKPAADVLRPFIDDVNEHGGINGRQLRVAISHYSPLVPADLQTACVEQSEDYKVFASFASAGFGSDGEVCMASKQTPLITSNNSSAKSLYEREQGWVRSTAMTKDRTARSWVDQLLASGTATPATRIGIIRADDPEDNQLVDQVLLPYMKSKGLNVVEQASYAGTTVDTVTAESNSAIVKFKSKGVDLVLPVLDFLRTASFVTTADSNKYKPRYSVSDLGSLSNDFTTSFYPATQWTGTTGVTAFVTGSNQIKTLPDTPAFKECQSIYNAHGQQFTTDPASVGAEVVGMMYFCEHVHLFVKAALAAGPHLNRATLLRGFDSINGFAERVTLTNPLTFGPQKFDGADDVAVIKWQPACYAEKLGCYRQIRGFAKGTP